MPVSSINNVLQGKVPGLTVTSSSGTPGAGSVTHIRGIGSITGSTTPSVCSRWSSANRY